MATSKSFTVNVEIEDNGGRPSTVTTKFKDAHGRTSESKRPVNKATTASVNGAIGELLKLLADSAAGFVDMGDKAPTNVEPDGFQGDVPQAEKDRIKKEEKRVDAVQKDADKKDTEKAAEPKKPDAPAKPAAGDKAEPPAKK
jgi:hypothetical protein